MIESIKKSLSKKYLVGLTFGLVGMSLAFLLLFQRMYQHELKQLGSQTSIQINKLLQASLENAMLKRDLPGLARIVQRLGEQPDILDVVIANPAGEVRFASDPSRLGKMLPGNGSPQCKICPDKDGLPTESTDFIHLDNGTEALRSINPVHNKQPCNQCHGPTAKHPVNGVLLIDYDAGSIRKRARNTTLMLMSSGAVIVLITVIGGLWFMRHVVVKPLANLSAATYAFSHGILSQRVAVNSKDEVGQLGHAFNDMAETIQSHVEKIQQNEAFLQQLIDAIPDGIRVIDSDFNVVLANRAYYELLKLDKDSTPTKCYEQSHGRDAPCPPTLIACPLHEIRHKGFVSHKSIQTMYDRNGDSISTEVYSAPLFYLHKGKKKWMIVESIRDLQKEIQLSHELKLSAIGQLAAGIAHEIHNPLGSIRLALHATLRSLSGDNCDKGQVREYLGLVDHEIDRCIDITARLLKLSASATDIPQPVRINKAIKETASLLQWEASQDGIDIELQLDPTDPRVIITDSEIRIVVLNMIQNALHAMPDGGTIQIRSEKSGSQVKIHFIDNGIGISAEDMPHIFDPFFSHRVIEEKGTGLGLTICKTIVERYDGHLHVESAPGKGAHFTMTLPDTDHEISEVAL
ncbi:MAG: histidine kinase [Gammaproteobacteria bacterium]|nr:MAG: histidine kinase [Gammaproteobacteria bacterium]